jgi:Antidote-toxin recognition MazE, bacterial antitoxin
MQVQVARWGNSLGLRIPKDIAPRAGLREGARIVISPAWCSWSMGAVVIDRLVLFSIRHRSNPLLAGP